MTQRLDRSYLFVPATRLDRVGKALASGAHTVIVDLEDAVAPADKAAARTAVAKLEMEPGRVLVRINAAGTPWFDEDLAAVTANPAVTGIVLPKAEQRADLERISALKPALSLYPLIESAVGLANASTLAAHPAVVRLMFGSLDFQVDLGIEGDGPELLYFRSQLVRDSRLANKLPPVDGVCIAVDDEAALQAEVLHARRMGLGGKLCIHPRQVEAVNRGFAPTTEEVSWARRVLELVTERGTGVSVLDGKMVDKPVVDKAQRILATQAAL